MANLKIPGRGAGLAIKGSLVLVAVSLLLLPGSAARADPAVGTPAGEGGRALIVVLPPGTTPEQLTRLDRVAIGLMNPGLGEVSPQQTWLDVSQGARAFDSTYDRQLDTLSPNTESVSGWERTVRRARSAGTEIVPGLLASALARNGLRAAATARSGPAALAVVTRDGSIARAPDGCGGAPGRACPDDLTVLPLSLDDAARLARERSRRDLIIFVEQPPAAEGDQLSIAVAGPALDGMLESPSTRTDGYVLSTDLAPTILRHFGLRVPSAMTGQPVEAGGELDLEGLSELQNRYEQVGKRRGAALAIPLLLWIALAGMIALATRGRLAAYVLRVLCLATVSLPAVLLLTAALEPSLAVERGIATALPVAIAAILLRVAPGWPALALACGLTVVPYGVDMLAGSALTPRAVIGPNPGLGARFYGIGNELESTLMILTAVGTGAALTWGKVPARRSAVIFLTVGAVATVVFAAGRFGADVGAAIVFPVAAVVAASVAVGRPRLAWTGLAAAAAALLVIGIADIVTGSETHFVRSVVGGSGGSFFDVVGQRLDATLESFTRVSRIPVTVVAVLLIGTGWLKRKRIEGWISDLPYIRAGLLAAAAGSLVGAVTNDSGALFIQVGTLYLALVLGFAWAEAKPRRQSG